MEPEVVGAQFRIYRSTAGFVRVDWFDGADVTGQDAHEALQAIGSLTVGRQTPVLADVRSGRSVSREARKAFADTPVASRVALLVGTSLSRVIANFVIGVSHPSVPTRMFTDLDAAQQWLLDEG